jgi:hypothetical protein
MLAGLRDWVGCSVASRRLLLALILGTLSLRCAEPRTGYPDGGGPGIGPAFDGGPWVNATANLAGLGSECGNMSFVSAKPDEDLLLAGIAQQGIWASSSDTADWIQLGTTSTSATITNRTTTLVYDSARPHTFWESGIYNAGGVYRTDDDGVSWIQLGDVTDNDLVSVDLSDPQRRTLLAGGHESPGVLLRSVDGGDNWTDIGPLLPASAGDSSFPLVINGQTLLLGTWRSDGAGVFRSTDGGGTWTQVFAGGVYSHPLTAADQTLYWLRENNQGLIKSTDHGATWSQVAGSGIFAVLGSADLIELPDHRLAALGLSALIVSKDQGVTWVAVSSPLPFSPTGLTYSAFRKAFYVWHFDCTPVHFPGDPVPPDAILRSAFDYLSQ